MERESDFIFGTTGSGKTYFMIHTLIPKFKSMPVIIIDSMEEYNLKGFIITENFSDLLIFLRSKTKIPKVIYRINPDKNKTDFTLICRLVSCLNNICFVIDEIAYYQDEKENEYLNGILRRGRHYNQSIIIATQCPIDVPPHFRNNVTSIYFFRLMEKRYIDYCKSIIGEHADNLSTLKLGEYVKYPEILESKPIK